MTDQNTPPGWYPDGSGGQRYWDGQQWAPLAPSGSQTGGPVPGADQPKLWQQPVVIVLGLLCCSPVGLVLTWLQPKWSTATKIVITAVVVGLMIVGGVIAGTTSADLSSPTLTSDLDSSDDDESDSDAGASDDDPDDGVFEITVTSTGSGSANSITFVDPTNDSFQMSQENGKTLPWTKTFTGVDSVPLGWNMNAQQNGGGDLKCVVTLDGKVIAENTSSGSYAMVTCTP